MRWSHSSSPALSAACGHASPRPRWRQLWFESERKCVRVVPGGAHHVRRAVDGPIDVLVVGVVPRDDRLEAAVQVEMRPHGVVGDPPAERAEALDRPVALARVEVVEDRPGHQAPRRPHPRVVLDLRQPDRGREREVYVVADEQVSRLRRSVEPRQAIAARLGGPEQLAVVLEREPAGRHAASTSTSTRRAAASARAIASSRVRPSAMT